MSLAIHTALPPIFHVHPEIKHKTQGGLNINLDALNGRTFFGCEVETNTYWDKPYANIVKRTGWLPAEDGSINGAEWKSPLILQEDVIPKEIEEIIDNSEYDNRCGGHIHAVRADWNDLHATDAWDLLAENWAWLFAVLYPGRLTNQYSYVKYALTDGYGYMKAKHERNRTSKYCWLHLCAANRMEFRIFPAVHSTLRLKNRMRLLEVLLGVFHQAYSPDEAFTIAMDHVIPEMQKHGAMKNFPRKSQYKIAVVAARDSILWPKNISFPQRKAEQETTHEDTNTTGDTGSVS